MKRLLLICLFALSTTCVFAISAFASGFALYENSSSGAAVCGAFVATANDASAVWYNPAGIVQLEGTHILGGFTAYSSNGGIIQFDGSGAERTRVKGATIPVPYFYTSHKLTDTFWLGFGVFSPFGLETEYDENWGGRYNTYYSGDIAREYNTNLVYKVNNSLSLGAGVSLQQFKVEFKQKINAGAVYLQGQGLTVPPTDPNDTHYPMYTSLADVDFDQHLTANDDSEFRYNLSLMYTLNENVSFGLHYRSEVDYTLTGDATYTDVLPIFSTNIHNADVSGAITLPRMIWTGVAVNLTPKLTIETDLVMTGWSSYDKLQFNIDNSLGTQTVTKNWDDVYSLRIGTTYAYSNALVIKGGYLYDESPIPAETLDYAMPSSDRHMFSTGFGYTFGKWTIDTHYAYVTLIGSRSIGARPAEFMNSESSVEEVKLHQLGLNVSYRF